MKAYGGVEVPMKNGLIGYHSMIRQKEYLAKKLDVGKKIGLYGWCFELITFKIPC
jgi:hypothetical protein